MDDSDPAVDFDENGVCWYCREWEQRNSEYGKLDLNEALKRWSILVGRIKKQGRDKRYDCVIGLSGGIDSSYTCYVAKEYGLRALLIHASTGFDSPVAKRNLWRVVDHTGFDIHVVSVDPDEFRKVQLAYLYASVLDTDVPADYLIEANIRIAAIQNKIRYVLSGGNYYADAFMPKAWNYANKMDFVNLRNIVKAFGDCELKTFPRFGAFEVLLSKYLWRIRYCTPLNFVDYTRPKALEILKSEWGYESYGDKHDENIFTRFYQRFILPTKFGVDKRKMNLSNYVRSGGLSRAEALNQLNMPVYSSEMFESDKQFVLSALGLSESQFDWIMSLPPIPHEVFGSDRWVYNIEKPYLLLRKTVKNLLRLTSYGRKKYP